MRRSWLLPAGKLSLQLAPVRIAHQRWPGCVPQQRVQRDTQLAEVIGLADDECCTFLPGSGCEGRVNVARYQDDGQVMVQLLDLSEQVKAGGALQTIVGDHCVVG